MPALLIDVRQGPAPSMPASQPQRAIAVVALTGAAAAFMIHLASVLTDPPVGMEAMFVLFPLGILSWGALMRRVNRDARARGEPRTSPFSLLAPLPVWSRLLFGAVFFYAILNFLLFFQATGGGTIERQPSGEVVLSDHGRVIRALDPRGVHEIDVWQVRLFSGHSLPFLLLPGLYFWFASGDDGRQRESPTPAP